MTRLKPPREQMGAKGQGDSLVSCFPSWISACQFTIFHTQTHISFIFRGYQVTHILKA